MADKLTPQQIEDFSELNLRKRVIRTLTIDNDSIALTDITEFGRDWGNLKTSLYNKHPDDRGQIDYPLLTIGLDASAKTFDMGGPIFPQGRNDFKSTVARILVVIDGKTFLDFEGAVLEPELSPSGTFNLIIEHPLTNLTRKKWVREDRIGGDTGLDFFFNS